MTGSAAAAAAKQGGNGSSSRMVDSESKWSPDPKDGASSEVSEEGTASTVQTQQSSSIVTLPPLGKDEESSAVENGTAGGEAAPHRAIPLSALDSFSGLSKHRVFEWNIGDYTVPSGKKETKTILKGVAGRAENGTFSAIMGPSGCGKTSLLDCLALRNRTFNGALRLDGLPLTGSFFLNTGYVHQKELFFHHLTVREHLTFHAITRMSRIRSRSQCIDRVDKVMEEVDLAKVADNTIGGGDFYTLKGLSGGERKRLNIATELLADPSILLLDEPTSGLDSVMGEIICLLLRNIAVRHPKRIVVTAIHTPSSRVFMLFTHVTLLTSKGELAYWGRRADLLPFLEGLGYACPPLFNPADFVLELASAKVIKGQAGSSAPGEEQEEPILATLPSFASNRGSKESSGVEGGSGGDGSGGKMSVGALLVASESAPMLVAATRARLGKELGEGWLEADNHHKHVMGVRGSKSSFWVSYRMNLWRSWLTQKREYLGLAVGTIMNITLGLVYGVLYFNQIPHDTGRNTLGFLFSLVVTLMISSSVAVCLYFPLDYSILMREYYAGANTAASYFLGRTMSSLPGSLHFLLNGIIPYFMTGLAPSAAAFGKFILTFAIMNYAAQSMGYLSSSFSANPIVGLSILPLFITPMILFSGMLYERHSVPPALEWLQDISLVNYGYALMVINQAEHASEGVRGFLLTFLQVKPDEWTKFLLVLAVLSVAYRWLAMAILCIRVRFISKPT